MARKRISWVLLLLAIAFGVAVFLSPIASTHPDGLERVAEDYGFVQQAQSTTAWQESPLPDYRVPGIHNEALSTALSGLAGTLIAFAFGFGVAKLVARRNGKAS